LTGGGVEKGAKMGCLALAHPPCASISMAPSHANHFPGKHLTVDLTFVPDEE